MTKKPAKTTPRDRRSDAAAAPPIEIDARALPPLGMPPERFLRDYWQKRPLLIRNAFPGFESPLQPEDLAGLACEEAALSRIVVHDRARDRWTLRHGPFDEAEFPGMPRQDWTLLVQDVDKWDTDVAALLPHFDFLPRWRIDDVMVSFAAPGGSVGAHVDQYDVFLLQAQGRRRWQIDARPDPPLDFRPDVELKLLREFRPSHDWVLGPGDMLYLPPGVPHHGVAEDACLTFSVGMRAPSAAELLGDFVDTLASEADESLRYADPDLAPPADPNEIDEAAMNRAVAALNRLRMNDPDRLGDWFGRFITLYRAAGEVQPGEDRGRSRIEIEWDLQRGAALLRHPWSRMAWRRARRRGAPARLYVSGHAYALPEADARRLAGAARLDGTGYAALSEAGRDCAIELLQAGHYRLALLDEEDEA
ncbi:50S ribosomal protein L16 3-hydroxylase [Vulcaniibacterium tengchongense]|uniref:50S ribosomal protein L16 3-hydroxylase n=2 Tax=Vulcaniibacterium tengchongense TaxID=1273429 RepID=A0A3N4W607_9GAMM|nr:cupin domain-containing protein [Vulcaniibacterium tengchongense]RPE81520.1 50S ribosomal protein L16 3-hydroxylase [Vulcaniibacterium tengchongense]